MCLGNRAGVSTHYVNGQLRSLYENALHCTSMHGSGLKPKSSAVEYATCLAEFYGPGKHSHHPASVTDLSFFAKFGQPRLEFVCNHEVVLFLEAKEGHYNKDQKSGSKRETFSNITIAFRIPFSSHTIENFHCKAIGNADSYTTILHVLSMDTASYLPEHSETTGVANVSSLIHYLLKYYLPLLRRAGHHVFHSLPDFDNLTLTTSYIDYSTVNTRSLATDVIYNIRVEEINTYLRGLWLQAAAFVDEHGLSEDTIAKSFLAELRFPVADVVNMHMHFVFGPLHIQPLCSREVILYLDIQDINIYNGSNKAATAEIKDWKLAFVVNVKLEERDDGCSRRVILDLESVRFCEHLSIFSKCQDKILFERTKTILIKQFTTYYLSILEKTETTIIFHHDVRIHDIPVIGSEEEEIDSYECTCLDDGSCGHRGCVHWGILDQNIIRHSHTGDFDFVTALTQQSINSHFKALWDAASRTIGYSGSLGAQETLEFQKQTCLAHFSYRHSDHGEKVFFSSTFSAPMVQLNCSNGSNSVILYININDGYFRLLGPKKTLLPGSDKTSFAQWRLAYEVDLKLRDSSDNSISKSILSRLGLQQATGFKQLILALSTAKLNLSLSTLPGLLDGTDYRSIRARREAIEYYMHTCYFSLLRQAHYHVLYTIPMAVPQLKSLTKVVSFKYEIVPFTYSSGSRHRQGLYGKDSAIFDRNTIVIMGVTDSRDISSFKISREINWVCGYGKEIPHGVVCLSRKSFLEGRLFGILEKINRETTIIPSFSGISDGEWVIALTNWNNHEMKKHLKCKWTERQNSSLDRLEFEWKNRDLWKYEHEGDLNNGCYAIECKTSNIFSIPTGRSSTPSIIIKGEMKMTLSYQGPGLDWSGTISASWAAAISFTSTSSGLQIQLQASDLTPRFNKSSFASGSAGSVTFEKAFTQFKHVFPSKINCSGIMQELRSRFEGLYTGINLMSHELCVARPVFNRRGDFLLELAVRSHASDHSLLPIGSLVSGALKPKRSTLSLNGAKPVEMNGNGNNTTELFQVFRKVGETVSEYTSFSSVSNSTKTSSTAVSKESEVRKDTVTVDSKSSKIKAENASITVGSVTTGNTA